MRGAPKGSKNRLGKKCSEETKRKISEAKKGKRCSVKTEFKKGSKANWKGGICEDMKKYHRERYKNLSEENKKRISWSKNKRNRVIKRLKNQSLSHTFGEWELLKKQYGNTCPCCKKSEPEIKLTEDHIIPLSKGGSDLIENIQPLCLSCNTKKHTSIIKY